MSRIVSAFGSVLRSAGQAIDRLGIGVQGKCGYIEKLVPALTTVPFQEGTPVLGKNVFVAPNATVVGDVKLGERASIWYGAVVRELRVPGDVNSVKIGDRTNIQDNAVIHVAKNAFPPGKPKPTIVGNDVIVGHGAILHACTIADGCLVGMGATLLDGVRLETNSIVAAGSLVPPNTVVPTGEVWAGAPAKLLRKLTVEEIEFIIASAADYAELAAVHLEENSKTFDQIVYDKNLRWDKELRTDDYDSHLGILRDPKTREIKYMAPI